MAYSSNVKGITIEIGGDFKALTPVSRMPKKNQKIYRTN